MRYLTVLLTLSYFLSSCSKNQKKVQSEINFEYSILEIPADNLKFPFEDFSKKWILESSDLLLAEKVILNALSGIDDSNFLCEKNLTKYVRQYIGYINTNGDHMIWVNAFCEMSRISRSHIWEKEIVTVDDGGDCYWNILINIDRMTVKEFQVNGDA